ncbi:MAG: GNAT family N-acetyltransferase, partial [Candidatus Hermodarchaeota archaeon]
VKNTLGQYIGYLDNWATKKEFIGKGVGKLLADKAIQILESWGTDSIRINLAYTTDKKLLDLFAKAGFQPIITVLEKRF